MPGKIYLLDSGHDGTVAVDGPAGGTSSVGALSIQVDSASVGPDWDGSLAVQGQLPDGTLIDIPYLNVSTNTGVDAATPITAVGLYEAASNGYPVALTYTHTAGSARLTLVNLLGPSRVPAALPS